MKTVLKVCITSCLVVSFLLGLLLPNIFSKPSEVLGGDRLIKDEITVQNLPDILLVGERYDLIVKLDKDIMGSGNLEVLSDIDTLVSFDSFSESGGQEDAVRIGYSNPVLSVISFKEGFSILRFKFNGIVHEVPFYTKGKPATHTSISVGNNMNLVLGELSEPIRIDLLDDKGNNSSLSKDLEISLKPFSGLEIFDSKGQPLVEDKLKIDRGRSNTFIYVKQILPTQYLPIEIESSLGNYSKEILVSLGTVSKVNYDFKGSNVYQAGEIVGPIKIGVLNENDVEIENNNGVTVQIVSSNLGDIECGTDSNSIDNSESIYLDVGQNTLFCKFYKVGERDISFFIDPLQKIDGDIEPIAFSIYPGPAINLVANTDNVNLELGEQEILSVNLVDVYGNIVYSDTAPDVRNDNGVIISSLDSCTYNIVGNSVGDYEVEFSLADYILKKDVSIKYGDVVSILPNQYNYGIIENNISEKIEFRGYNKYGINVPFDRDYILSSNNGTNLYDLDGTEYSEFILDKGELYKEGYIKNNGEKLAEFSSSLNNFTLVSNSPIIANSNVLGTSTKNKGDYGVKYIQSQKPLQLGEEVTLLFIQTDGYGNTVSSTKNQMFTISSSIDKDNIIGEIIFEAGNCFAKMAYKPDSIGKLNFYIYNEWNVEQEFVLDVQAGKPSRFEAISVDTEVKKQVVSEMYLFQLVDKYGNKTIADQDYEFIISSNPTTKISTVISPWIESGRIILYKGESVISFYISDSEIGENVITLSEVKHLIDDVKIYLRVGK